MNVLVKLLSSRVKAEVLRLLFGPAGHELHVREIARRAGLAEATVRQELRRLTSIGIVEARKDGNRTYYRANAKSQLYGEIRGLVAKTSGLVDLFRPALEIPGVRLAFIFGSLANGTQRPESDVDLMVVGTITLRQLSKALSGVASEVGREINPHVLSPSEFQSRREAGDHFVVQVLKSQRLYIIGDEDELTAVG